MPRLKKRWMEKTTVAPAPVSPAQVTPRYLGLRDAAKYLGHKSHWIVYRWIQRGLLRANRETKQWTVAVADLDALWASQATKASQ